MNPPLVLLAARFLFTLTGSRNGFLLYFSDAVPKGLKIEPAKVLQLRRNFMMLNLVLIVLSWTFAMWAQDPIDGAIGLLLMGFPTFWLIGILRGGVDRGCLAKQPTDLSAREGIDAMLLEHPSVGAFVAANQSRSSISPFEMELLMVWAMHEKRQLMSRG